MARNDIRKADGWRRMMARRFISGAADEAFVQTLSAAQVKQLATICEQFSVDERRHAMRLLLGLNRANDPRMTSAIRKQWLHAAHVAARLAAGAGWAG